MSDAPVEPRRPLTLRRKLTFALITLVLLLGCVEVAGRVVSYVAYGFNPYYLLYGFYSWTNDEGVGHSEKHGDYFKFPPNSVIKYGTPSPCRINNHGMRGVDFDDRKAPGTFRVVCMGASSTFGYTDTDEGTYPRILQKLFDEDGLSPKVEVINAGIPHMTSRNIVAFFEDEIVGYEPDVVTFYEGYNDAVHCADENRVQAACRWLDEHSAAYAGLRKVVNSAFGRVLYGWWDGYLPHVDKATAERQAKLHAEQMGANLTRMIETAKAKGVRVILMKQAMTQWFDRLERGVAKEGDTPPPYEQQVREMADKLEKEGGLLGSETIIYVHRTILTEIQALADRHGLSVVDNIALMDQHPEDYSSFVHLNEAANARLAAEMHKTIRRMQAGQ